MCDAGYSGSVSATSEEPFYESMCTAVQTVSGEYSVAGITEDYFLDNKASLTAAFESSIADLADVSVSKVTVSDVTWASAGRMRRLADTQGTISTQYAIEADSEIAANNIISDFEASASGSASDSFIDSFVAKLQAETGGAPLDVASLSVASVTVEENNNDGDDDDDDAQAENNNIVMTVIAVVLAGAVLLAVIAFVIVYMEDAPVKVEEQESDWDRWVAAGQGDSKQPEVEMSVLEDSAEARRRRHMGQQGVSEKPQVEMTEPGTPRHGRNIQTLQSHFL